MTAPRTAAPDDVERLRRQNHEHAAMRDRESADLRSRVDRYERLMADARERVRNWPVDWTNHPPSQEPDGWWRYTSTNHALEVAALVEAVRAEAIEPLLALVRAAQDVHDSAVDYSSEERSGVYPFGLFAAVEHRLDKALAALPESIRAAARKPE